MSVLCDFSLGPACWLWDYLRRSKQVKTAFCSYHAHLLLRYAGNTGCYLVLLLMQGHTVSLSCKVTGSSFRLKIVRGNMLFRPLP